MLNYCCTCSNYVGCQILVFQKYIYFYIYPPICGGGVVNWDLQVGNEYRVEPPLEVNEALKIIRREAKWKSY